MRIPQPVMQVLEASRVDGNGLFLPGQLDRALYVQVNKVLEAIGAKWSRGLKCHLLPEDGAALVSDVLDTGEYRRVKQDLGQFDTSPELAGFLIRHVGGVAGKNVFEPSAGIGNIAIAALEAGAEVWCSEIDPKRFAVLKSRLEPMGTSWHAECRDFLEETPKPGNFDVVLMNPPFAKQVDIDHVLHAMTFLAPGGRLAAIMSAGVKFRANRKTTEFRLFVNQHGGTILDLPENSFVQAGTSVQTVVVEMVA